MNSKPPTIPFRIVCALSPTPFSKQLYVTNKGTTVCHEDIAVCAEVIFSALTHTQNPLAAFKKKRHKIPKEFHQEATKLIMVYKRQGKSDRGLNF